MCAFFFENPVINPSGKLQFICSLFKVLNPTCATRRRGLSAGFFWLKELKASLGASVQMKVECTKVSGERLELEIGEACFVSDLKVGKLGEGCCLWSLGGLDFMGVKRGDKV